MESYNISYSSAAGWRSVDLYPERETDGSLLVLRIFDVRDLVNDTHRGLHFPITQMFKSYGLDINQYHLEVMTTDGVLTFDHRADLLNELPIIHAAWAIGSDTFALAGTYIVCIKKVRRINAELMYLDLALDDIIPKL